MPIISRPAAPGGGSLPSTFVRASYGGDDVTIANGANANLTWDDLGSGDAVLDLTDPETPVVLAGGIYSVTVSVLVDAQLTSGGGCNAVLHLDSENDDAVCQGSTVGGDTASQQTFIALNNTFYIPVGGGIRVRVWNYDGASARPFNIDEAIIQMVVPESS